MRKFLAAVIALIGVGGVLWYVAYRPQFPLASQARLPQVALNTTQLRSIIQDVDQSVANTIRRTAEEGISWPSVGSWSAVNNLSEATISAQLSTTPGELWRTFREEGSQAVLGGLAKNAEVSVNNVSTQVMNEARYQYCLGVVEEFERTRSVATEAAEVSESTTPASQ